MHDPHKKHTLKLVHALARLMGGDAKALMQSFTRYRRQISPKQGPFVPWNDFEFVATAKAGQDKIQSFGSLLRPCAQGDLKETLSLFATNCMQLLLDENPSPKQAELFALCFAAAYPDLDAFLNMPATADSMLWSRRFGLGKTKTKMVGYFNTRLFPKPGHRDRVLQMLERFLGDISLATAAYDGLYPRQEIRLKSARFLGVGLDFSPEGEKTENPPERRAKIYAMLDRNDAHKALQSLGTTLEQPSLCEAEYDKIQKFTNKCPKDALTDDFELGIVLRSGGASGVACSFKMTFFFDENYAPWFGHAKNYEAFLAKVGGMQPSLARSMASVLALLDTRKASMPAGQSLLGAASNKKPGHALHGMGISIGRDTDRTKSAESLPEKINIYLQP